MWHKSEDYWAWMCPNAGCDRFLVESQNQSGDPVCPWCDCRRRLIGHFVGGGRHGVYRDTVIGGVVKGPDRASSYYFQPPKNDFVK